MLPDKYSINIKISNRGRMARGIKLVKVLGIQISIDYSWFIIFVIFAWSLAYGYFPMSQPGLGKGAYLFMGVISALLLFVCVLIHEISHSYTSNKLGLEVKEITLFIFGGVAQLTKEPDDAIVELKIAIAGPLASAVLAVIFYTLARVINSASFPLTHAIVSYLGLINLVLLIFNMIPGFPLDGGRVFRAIWWARTGDMNKATKIASQIGKGFAAFLIIWGFFSIFTGNFTGGLWSVLIGVFVQQAAESGYQQVLMKKTLEGVKVRDLMSRNVVTVQEEMSILDAVEKYFFKYHYISFPVTSNRRVVGLLSLYNVRTVEKERWETTLVRDVMHRLGPEDILSPDDNAMDVFTKMTGDNGGRYPVLDKGELVGIISRRDIMKMMEFKAGLQSQDISLKKHHT